MTFSVIIRGPLGSGKTTIAKLVARELKGRYISVDKLLEERGLDTVRGGCIPEKNFLKVNAIILEKWEKEKRLVVVDGCFYYKRVLDELVRKTGARVFTLELPVDVCVARDARRKRRLGEGACRQVHKLVGRFGYGVVVDARRPVAETVKGIVFAVRQIKG